MVIAALHVLLFFLLTKRAGTFSADKNEILFSECGVNYNNEPAINRKGSFLFAASGKVKKQRKADKHAPRKPKRMKFDNQEEENTNGGEAHVAEANKCVDLDRADLDADPAIRLKKLDIADEGWGCGEKGKHIVVCHHDLFAGRITVCVMFFCSFFLLSLH